MNNPVSPNQQSKLSPGVQMYPPQMQQQILTKMPNSGTIIKRITLEEYNAQKRIDPNLQVINPPNQQPIISNVHFVPARQVQFVQQQPMPVPMYFQNAPNTQFVRAQPQNDKQQNQIYGTILENLNRMTANRQSEKNINLKTSIVIEKQTNLPNSGIPNKQTESRNDVSLIYSKLAQVQNEVNELREKNQNLVELINKTPSENYLNDSQVKSGDKQVQDNKQLDDQVNQLLNENYELKKNLKEKNDNFENIKSENNDLQMRLQKQAERISVLKNEQKPLEESSRENENLKKKIKENQKLETQKDKELNDLEVKYREIMAENIHLKNENSKFKGTLEQKKTEVNELLEKIIYLNFKINENSKLSEKVEFLVDELNKEKAKAKSANLEQNKIESQGNLETENQNLRKMIDELNSENENFHEALNQSANTFEKYAEKVKTQNQINDKLEKEKQDLNERISNLELENEILRSETRKIGNPGFGKREPENHTSEKISNMVMEDIDMEMEHDQIQENRIQEIASLENDVVMLGDQLMERDYKVQHLKVERFENQMRMVFAFSEIERLRNRHIPF